MNAPRIVVMGVSGCGKSTVGAGLAARLGVPFLEGDDLHPPENVARMRRGVALDDAHRARWLDDIAERLTSPAATRDGLVVSCSALKREYRDRLRARAPDLRFVHLRGDPALIAHRMATRSGHYMPASLLDSQLRTLEPPGPDEQAITLDIAQAPSTLIAQAIEALEIAV